MILFTFIVYCPQIRAEKLKLVKEAKAAVERAYSHSEGSGSSSAEEATELAVVTAKPPPKVTPYIV